MLIQNDKISVIIPVYKVERYLHKCIDSVLAQTYTNLEIILVDDGSTDGCANICDEYAALDSRIMVIHKVNGGLSDARNFGLNIFSGKYIGFVDSDDYIHPDMYRKLFDALIRADADLSICNFECFDDMGHYNEDYLLPIQDEVTTGMSILEVKLFEKHSHHWVVTVTKLYRSKLFSSVRFFKDHTHEDEYILHEILLLCNNVVTIKDKLYYYYQRDGSITNCGVSAKSFDGVIALFRRAEALEEVNSISVEKAVIWAIAQYLQLLKKLSDKKDHALYSKLDEIRKYLIYFIKLLMNRAIVFSLRHRVLVIYVYIRTVLIMKMIGKYYLKK